MSNPYVDYAHAFERMMAMARHLPLGGFDPLPAVEIANDAPNVLLITIHPDDEHLYGSLAIRFRAMGMRVVVAAMTFGSNVSQRFRRLDELQNSCRFSGYDLDLPPGFDNVNTRDPATLGMSGVTPSAEIDVPVVFAANLAATVALLERHRPAIVIMPHDDDYNSSHIGGHQLGQKALIEMQRRHPDFWCHVVLAEYWRAMENPNLLVGFSPTMVGHLMAGTSFHVGECRRNPYQTEIPAWMANNVRRVEVMCRQGGQAPDFTFGALYEHLVFADGVFDNPYPAEEGKAKVIGPDGDLGEVFHPLS